MTGLRPSHLSPPTSPLSPLTSHLFSRSPRPQGKKETKHPFPRPAVLMVGLRNPKASAAFAPLRPQGKKENNRHANSNRHILD